MHLVSFSTDRRILTEGSVLQSAYAAQCTSYTLYVLSRAAVSPKERRLAETGKAVLLSFSTLCSFTFWHTLVCADVVSVQDPFETGYIGLFFAYLFFKPLHVQVHTDIFSPHFAQVHPANGRRQRWALFVLRRAKRIRVVSQHIRGTLVERGVHCPVTVLPIFVDTTRFARLQHQPHPEYAYHFVAIGRLEPEKQFTEAIRALALVRAKGYAAGLTIVGEGSQRTSLEHMAQEYGVRDQVMYAGSLTDITPVLSTATALLVPSAYEGYGLVLIEACAAHVPVIAYDVGVAREVGAVIAPQGQFAETVLQWVTQPKADEVPMTYPYHNREAYVGAWIKDVRDCI